MIHVADLCVSRILFFEIGPNDLVYDYKLKIKTIFEPISKNRILERYKSATFIKEKKQLGKILNTTGEIWQRKLFFPIGLTQRL